MTKQNNRKIIVSNDAFSHHKGLRDVAKLKVVKDNLAKIEINNIQHASSLDFVFSTTSNIHSNALVISSHCGIIPDLEGSFGDERDVFIGGSYLKRIPYILYVNPNTIYDALKNNIYMELDDSTNIDTIIEKSIKIIKESMGKETMIEDGRVIETRIRTYKMPDNYNNFMLKYAREEIARMTDSYTRNMELMKVNSDLEIARLKGKVIPSDMTNQMTKDVKIYYSESSNSIFFETLRSYTIKIEKLKYGETIKDAPTELSEMLFVGKFRYRLCDKKYFFIMDEPMERDGDICFHPHISDDSAICTGSLRLDDSDDRRRINNFLMNIPSIIDNLKTINLESIYRYEYINKYMRDSNRLFNALPDHIIEANKTWTIA